MRVLHELNQKQKGIILFHDIHKQGVLALSPVIEELQRQNYTFLALDDGNFVKSRAAADRPSARPIRRRRRPRRAGRRADAKRTFYRESWAVIIGINDYQTGPNCATPSMTPTASKTRWSTSSASSSDHIRKLINGDATRQRIMQVLGDEFTDGNKVQREDRVFFFFAGHGATRTFDDGRQIGFIVPVDADRENYVSTAISMTAVARRQRPDRRQARLLRDGLLLQRPGAFARRAARSPRDHSYLEEVTRRTARADPHRRRRRSAGGRRRARRPLRLHLGAAPGPGRQGRSGWQRRHHRFGTRRVHQPHRSLVFQADARGGQHGGQRRRRIPLRVAA